MTDLRRKAEWLILASMKCRKCREPYLIEEMADVLMYYNDVMLCYGITAEELKQTYVEKFEKNLERWQY